MNNYSSTTILDLGTVQNSTVTTNEGMYWSFKIIILSSWELGKSWEENEVNFHPLMQAL